MKRIIIISAIAALMSTAVLAQERPSRRAFVMPERLVSHEQKDGKLIFRYSAPDAEKVALSGSWMEGFMAMEPMSKNEKGVWEVAIDCPKPDMYQYSFFVDGKSMTDPVGINMVRDGNSYKSVIAVRGNEPQPYEYNSSTQHGTLEKVWYPASVYGFQKRVSVYLPYGYNGRQKYPVFYLQHGGGGDEEAWVTLGRVCEIMDYMIERGLCKPMIVVMPNCCNVKDAASFEVTLPDVTTENMADPDFAEGISHVKSMYTDLIPFIESHYKVKKGKENRAVAGLSMGGIYTLNLTQQRPDLFDYIGVLSMGTTPQHKAEDQLNPVKKDGYKVYFVGCGKTDIAWGNAERLLKGLDDLGMEYTWFSDVPGHQWETWRKCLQEFAPMLF